jgi:hypothetical protein
MGKDGDDDEILRQVRDALDALDLGSSDTRDALVGGVKDALGKVRDGFDDVATRVAERGGRGNRPDLRVVNPDDTADESSPTEATEDSEADQTSVRVHWVDPGTTRVSPRRGLSVGAIHVPPPEEDAAVAWQTVLHAKEAKLIRVVCDEGALEVTADGALVCRLLPAQTIDVQAKVVRVCGVEGPAVGRYSQL